MEIDVSTVGDFLEGGILDIDVQISAVGETTGEQGILSIDRKSSAVGDGIESDTGSSNIEVTAVGDEPLKDADSIHVKGLAVGDVAIEGVSLSIQVDDAAVGKIAVEGQFDHVSGFVTCNSHGTGVGDIALEDGAVGSVIDPEITGSRISDFVEIVDSVQVELTAVGGDTVELVVAAVQLKLGTGSGVCDSSEGVAIAADDDVRHIGRIAACGVGQSTVDSNSFFDQQHRMPCCTGVAVAQIAEECCRRTFLDMENGISIISGIGTDGNIAFEESSSSIKSTDVPLSIHNFGSSFNGELMGNRNSIFKGCGRTGTDQEGRTGVNSIDKGHIDALIIILAGNSHRDQTIFTVDSSFECTVAQDQEDTICFGRGTAVGHIAQIFLT